jgi:hypothetical protein
MRSKNIAILTRESRTWHGHIAGFDKDGKILVKSPELEMTLPCYYVRNSEGERVQLNTDDSVLFIIDADNKSGYIMGVIEPYYPHLERLIEEIHTRDYPENQVEVEVPGKLDQVRVNGKKILIEADEEIQLKCGKGVITVDKDGKIIVKGTNLLSRSSGPQRIKGASVSIN